MKEFNEFIEALEKTYAAVPVHLLQHELIIFISDEWNTYSDELKCNIDRYRGNEIKKIPKIYCKKETITIMNKKQHEESMLYIK